MKITIKLLSLCVVLLMTACQKDDMPNPNSNVLKVKSYKNKVVTAAGDSLIANYNLNYDENDRIISVIQAEAPGNKYLFSYSANNRLSMDIYQEGTLSIHKDFFLNSNYLVDSTYQYDHDTAVTSQKYFYEANDQLATIKQYDEDKLVNVMSFTYDNDGNVVRTTDTNNLVETMEYYPNLVYANPVTIPIQSTKPMHLRKTYKLTRNGNEAGSVETTYTFDNKNRISTITQTFENQNVSTQTFTYF